MAKKIKIKSKVSLIVISIFITTLIVIKYWFYFSVFTIIGVIVFLAIKINKIIKDRNKIIVKQKLDRSLTVSQVDLMNGVDFEHYVSRLLINEHFLTAKVTEATNDYGVDIVANDNTDMYAIQVKRYTGNVSRTAVSDAVAGMSMYNCNKAMVVTNSYFTKGAKELANSTSCILIDRDELSKWIFNYQNKTFVEKENSYFDIRYYHNLFRKQFFDL